MKKNKSAPKIKNTSRRVHKITTNKSPHNDDKFRLLFESAANAMLMVGKEGRIVLVNEQVEKLFGYERNALIGQKIEVLIPELLQPPHKASRSAYLEISKPLPRGAAINLFGLRKDGSQFTAEVDLNPIETGEGKLITAAIRDVTEKNKDLVEQNLQMQTENRLKNEFLANMSHELRTPLNAIIGFTALMHDGKAGVVTNTQKEYLGDVLTSSQHLLQLINDILDLAKIESGKMEFNIEIIDLQQIVDEVKDILRGLATERDIEITVMIHSKCPQVRLDARMLKQVLYNYLSNAIKFTPVHGQVSVTIDPDTRGMFRIEITDTGIGIKPEDMNRLFVEFQQLDSTTKKKYPGTGLGLTLTKRIVEAQGGSVHVKSVFGQGSTFIAILPCDATNINMVKKDYSSENISKTLLINKVH